MTNFEIVQTFYKTCASGNLDNCLEIRDGKVVEMRDYFDHAIVERQLGLKD